MSAAREIRSRIKTYIHQKQDAREGFTETFKPLIETSEKVKETIDTQQNKLIEQLQNNQLALTQGLEGNRLAITSGFDKMDELKKLEVDQIPDLEAIEEPEMEEEPKVVRTFRLRDEIKRIEKDIELYAKLAKHAEEKGDIENKDNLMETINDLKAKKSRYVKYMEEKQKEGKQKEEKQKEEKQKEEKQKEEKQKEEKIFFDDTDFNKHLFPEYSQKILNDYGFQLPSTYKNLSLDDFDEVLDEAMEDLTNLKKKIKNVSEERSDKLSKYILAFPSKKASKPESIQNITKHNVLQIFFYNMMKLREIIEREKKGSGIIHFNNPQLAGSIIAME